MQRFFVVEVNEVTLQKKGASNNVEVGDEVIQVNNLYCEHIRNVTKYIETTHISSIKLRKLRRTNNSFILREEIHEGSELTHWIIGLVFFTFFLFHIVNRTLRK